MSLGIRHKWRCSSCTKKPPRAENVSVWPVKSTDNEWRRMKTAEYWHIDDLQTHAVFSLNSIVLLDWHSKLIVSHVNCGYFNKSDFTFFLLGFISVEFQHDSRRTPPQDHYRRLHCRRLLTNTSTWKHITSIFCLPVHFGMEFKSSILVSNVIYGLAPPH